MKYFQINLVHPVYALYTHDKTHKRDQHHVGTIVSRVTKVITLVRIKILQ